MPLPKAAKQRTRHLPNITPLACPACDEPVTLLGQWSAHNEKYWLCRDCSKQYRWQYELWAVSSSGEWTWKNGEPNHEILTERVELIGVVDDLVIKRKKIRKQVMKSLEHLMVKQLAFIKDLPEDLQLTWERQLRRSETWSKRSRVILEEARQINIPICSRCGYVHDNRYHHVSGFMMYCKRCNAELSVERFWQHKGIFGDADDETILDRIQKSHPEVFEIGVLPDYWFELKRRNL